MDSHGIDPEEVGMEEVENGIACENTRDCFSSIIDFDIRILDKTVDDANVATYEVGDEADC